MSTVLNVEKIFIPQEGPSQIQLSLVSLKPEPTLLISRLVADDTWFNEFLENPSYLRGNFFLDSQRNFKFADNLSQLESEPIGTFIESEQISVCSIFRSLAFYRSELVFKEEYYSDFQGGNSFENFKPDFSSVKFNAKNVLIGKEKFNIVLVALIGGALAYEEGRTSHIRNFPFKIVKNGELVHPYIDVILNDQNEIFLKNQVGEKIDEATYRIDLSKYPVFDDCGEYLNAATIFNTVAAIDDYRLKLRAWRNYIDTVKEKMRLHFILSEDKDWFYGEEMDEDYVSDVGSDYLRVFRSGISNLNSTQEVLNKLGKFGQDLKFIFTTITDLTEYDKNSMSSHFETFTQEILDMTQEGRFSYEDASLVLNLFDAYETEGDYLTRLKHASQKISDLSVDLNIMNLKLLSFRRELFKRFDHPDDLGFPEMSNRDRWKFKTIYGTLVAVRGVVKAKESVAISVDHNEED